MCVVPLVIASPLPVLLTSSCTDNGGMLFAAQRSGPAIEAGFFFTGMILTSIVSLPVMFALLSWLDWEQAILSVIGAFLMLIAAFSYQVIFNSDHGDDY
jgi:hypothetical protein